MVFQVTKLKSRTSNLARSPTPCILYHNHNEKLACSVNVSLGMPVCEHASVSRLSTTAQASILLYLSVLPVSRRWFLTALPVNTVKKREYMDQKNRPSSSMDAVGIVNQYHSKVIGETSSLQHKGHKLHWRVPWIVREVKWLADNYFNIVLKNTVLFKLSDSIMIYSVLRPEKQTKLQ